MAMAQTSRLMGRLNVSKSILPVKIISFYYIEYGLTQNHSIK